jgi:hypothetical protein
LQEKAAKPRIIGGMLSRRDEVSTTRLSGRIVTQDPQIFSVAD